MDGGVDRIHATAIALGGAAALIRGPSGAGKSDLALRCIDHAPSALIRAPVRLVADDQVILHRRGHQILVSSPPPIQGQIEVRGLGIVRLPHLEMAVLCLVVDLTRPEAIERLPDPRLTVELLGLPCSLLRLAPFEPSAAIKLLLELAKGGDVTAAI